MKATTEELEKVFEPLGADGLARKGAMFRFLNTTPEFYGSRANILKLCTGIMHTGGDFEEVQSYRDMFERLKASNAALESEPAPVVEKSPESLDANGFTEADRQRAKARLAVKQERELWDMPADKYREKIDDPALRRKHVR
jgi:hypothetical protein